MTQEFKILTNYDPFVCNYTEVAHKGKNNWTKCTSSGPVNLYSHVYDFRDPVPTENNQMVEICKASAPSSIKFDGSGLYELNNGQIVPIYNGEGENRECKPSAGIKNSEGICGRWSWERDGTITGLGFEDHSPLYFKRKLSINEAHSMDIKEYKEFCSEFRKLLAKTALYISLSMPILGGVYAVKNFDYVKATCGEYFQQYMPKITMERPEILK